MLETPSLDRPGGRLPLWVVPGGQPAGPAVLIIPSAFGLTPDLPETLAALAPAAARVVTFDPFFRTDPGPASFGDMPRVMARIQALVPDEVRSDLAALLAWIGGPTVVVGVCFGGPFAVSLAAHPAVVGVVTWHASRLERFPELLAAARAPLRLHFGDADPITPPAAIEAVRAALAGHPDAEVVVHPGATHGFSHPGAPAHEPVAAAAGRAAVAALLAGFEGKAS